MAADLAAGCTHTVGGRFRLRQERVDAVLGLQMVDELVGQNILSCLLPGVGQEDHRWMAFPGVIHPRSLVLPIDPLASRRLIPDVRPGHDARLRDRNHGECRYP